MNEEFGPDPRINERERNNWALVARPLYAGAHLIRESGSFEREFISLVSSNDGGYILFLSLSETLLLLADWFPFSLPGLIFDWPELRKRMQRRLIKLCVRKLVKKKHSRFDKKRI